jgi:hypothetical protein
VRHGGLPYVALDESDLHAVQRLEAQLKKHVPPSARPARGRIVDNFGVAVNGIRLLAFCNKHRSCSDCGSANAKPSTAAALLPCNSTMAGAIQS